MSCVPTLVGGAGASLLHLLLLAPGDRAHAAGLHGMAASLNSPWLHVEA